MVDAISFCQNTTMPLKCPRHSTKSHGSNVLFKYGFNVIQNWEMDALQLNFYWWVLIFLLPVMVEGDESRQPRIDSPVGVKL